MPNTFSRYIYIYFFFLVSICLLKCVPSDLALMPSLPVLVFHCIPLGLSQILPVSLSFSFLHRNCRYNQLCKYSIVFLVFFPLFQLFYFCEKRLELSSPSHVKFQTMSLTSCCSKDTKAFWDHLCFNWTQMGISLIRFES